MFSRARWRVRRVIEHIAFRLFTIGLIVVEMILVIVAIILTEDKAIMWLDIVSQIIISYFLLEILARIFYKGYETHARTRPPHVFTHARTHSHTHARMYARAYTHARATHTHAHTHTHINTRT
jgi:ABC-type nickel/cobalt efflux system permease component RcnA